MTNKNIRMIVDIAMTVLLPTLMAYSLIGEKFHEVAGTLMFVLFITHNIMNRGWYKALFKDKYNARRAFQTVLNLLLLIFMIMQPVSGILMSKHIYTFINIAGVSATAREIHLLFAYWGFILMSVHAGTHLTVPLEKLSRNKKSAWKVVIGILTTASIYGCYAFIKRKLPDYIFLKSSFAFFDYSEPRLYFFLDYISIMILFAFLGYLIAVELSKIETHKIRKFDK